MIKSLRDAVAKLYDMEGSLEDSINQLRLDTSILNTKVDGLQEQTETNKAKLDSLSNKVSKLQEQVSKLQDTLDSNTLDTKKLHTNHVLKGDTYKDEVDTTKPNDTDKDTVTIHGERYKLTTDKPTYSVVLDDDRLVHDEVAMVNTSDDATTYITQQQRLIAQNSLMYYILDDNDKTIVSSLDMNAQPQDIDKYMQAYTLQVEYVDSHKGSNMKVSKLYSNSPLRKYHEVTYVQSLLLERYQNEIVTTYGNNHRVSRQLTV